MDRRVLNEVKPIVSDEAIKAAADDAKQRDAAIAREEDARRARDEAVFTGYNRAPDREAPDSLITDPMAVQVTPDVSPPPFEAVGLDQTTLRVIEESGATLSPSTKASVAALDEEDRLVARADKAAAKAAAGDEGSPPRAEQASPRARTATSRDDTATGELRAAEPNEPQKRATSAPNQASEPNQPNTPDQPSQPNQPSQTKSSTVTKKTA